MAINFKLLQLCILLCAITVSADHCLACTYGESECQSNAYENCIDCPEVVGDVHSDLTAILSNTNSMARRLCRLTVDKKRCLLVTETANKIVGSIRDQMFPESPSESSERLACSHLLYMCKDVDSKGKELSDGAWSCASCQQFLNNVFTLLNTPLPKLNQAMASILCPTKDSGCLSAVSETFAVSGLLGDFLKSRYSSIVDADASSCSAGLVRFRGCQGPGGGNLSALRNSRRPMAFTLSSINVWIKLRTTPCRRAFPVNNSKSSSVRHVVAILTSSSFTSFGEDDEVIVSSEETLLLSTSVDVDVEIEEAVLFERVPIWAESDEHVLNNQTTRNDQVETRSTSTKTMSSMTESTTLASPGSFPDSVRVQKASWGQ